MKNWFSNFLLLHLIPIVLGVAFTFLSLYLFDLNLSEKKVKVQKIEGEQLMLRGRNANYESGIQGQIEIAGSLKNPTTITLMGSSELSEMPYTPYYFLPDSLQIPVVGFGHAHHQIFAIYCELLTMSKYLNKAKICIIISPGWFEKEGTNIEAFLEFVPSNYLKSIAQNKSIALSSKLEIGRYLSSYYSLIENPTVEIRYFRNLYLTQHIPILKNIIKKQNASATDVHYSVKIAKNTLPEPVKINWEKSQEQLQKSFIAAIQSNSIFVSDEYYTTYLDDKKRGYRKGNTDKLYLSSNREYADFKLLVKLLKKHNCNASFVIQPLNAYHYKDLENFDEIMDSVKRELTLNNFKYLNLFTSQKKEYEPAVLSDIMHFGDYGWMRVNQFIFNTYSKKIIQ